MRHNCPDCGVPLVNFGNHLVPVPGEPDKLKIGNTAFYEKQCPQCKRTFKQRKRQPGKPPAVQRYLNFIKMIASLEGKADWVSPETGLARLFLTNEQQPLPTERFRDPMEAMKHFKV